MEKVAWKMYYDDDTVFGSDGIRLPLRKWGVVCVAQPEGRTGREVVCDSDFYYLRRGRWFGADWLGLVDLVVHDLDEIRCVTVGRMTDRESYDRITKRAYDEFGLPRKSSFRKGEIRDRADGPAG